jgi:transposase InsO family protein
MRQSQRRVENNILKRMIREIYQRHKGRYGFRRITKELRKTGYGYNKKRIARLMREEQLYGIQKKKYKATTNSKGNKEIFPNLLKQRNKAINPGEVLVSDITYVSTEEGWLYLAVVMDLITRKILGYSMGPRITSELVQGACKRAFQKTKEVKIELFHSDRGIQYSSNLVKELLENQGISQSMSGKGNCYDNAAMESFFHTLKVELIQRKKYKSREEAKQDIFEYIEIYYNRQRIHSSIGYLTPSEFEMSFNLNKNVA